MFDILTLKMSRMIPGSVQHSWQMLFFQTVYLLID